MKNKWLTLPALLLSFSASAQCAFDPTITPTGIILCPNETDTLWTQQYDSYQWYRGANAIPGATNQYYVVDYFNDAGYNFRVEATLNSCTEISPPVLVDGWAFLPPFVMTAGDPGIIDQQGVQRNCPGDTVLLILMQPYTQSIQWTDNGNPIPGATDDTLVVTQPGIYSVSGAPAVCPAYQQQLGVNIPIGFFPVQNPVISMQGSLLICSPSGMTSYQWYLNNAPVSGATSMTYQPLTSGVYSVLITDANGCSFMSAPMVYTVGMTDYDPSPVVSAFPNPVQEELTIICNDYNAPFTVTLTDLAGRVVLRERFAAANQVRLPVAQLENGCYLLAVSNENNAVIKTIPVIKN